MPNPILDEALALAAAGIPVFPLRLTDKRPVVEGGFKAASTDPAEIARMFADPAAGLIGVPCGPASGFDAIDVDVKRGGLEWLQANEHRLPPTRRHHTRSSGVHLLLQHAPGMRTKFDRIAPGVEVRGEGGYIAWWPQQGLHTAGSGWAPWPDWLLVEALKGRRDPAAAPPAPDELAPPTADDLLTLLRTMPNPESVTRGEYVALNLAVVGCIRALETLGRCDGATADDIRDAAAEWSARWDSATASDFETERRRWESDWDTRTNGVSGWRHVLQIAERCGADVSAHRLATAVAEFGLPPAAPAAPAAAPAIAPQPEPKRVEPAEITEDSVSRAFAATHAGHLAFDHSAKRWFLFDGSVWRRDEAGRGFYLAREFASYARALFGNTDKPSAGIAFARNIERGAQSDPLLAVFADVWDSDPWLLGVPGGMVDLRTGALIPGDAAKYISKRAAVAPAAPGTDAPVWFAFLRFATNGDAEFQAWIQRFVGYALTGDVTEEILAFIYGGPGTGKGTLLSTVANILDAYGYQAPADLFKANPRVNPEYQLAKFYARRVIFASETEGGAMMAEAMVKELTGNEGKINARLPYGEPFEFRMTAKVVLVSNFAPRLRGRSAALERRLRVVPFERRPEAPDSTLKDRLRAEYPAILRWMIDGCLAWQRQGLGMCEVVRRASAAYFEEMDALGRWVAERLDLGVGQVRRTDLYADFAAWARTAGETLITPTEFYEEFRRAMPTCTEKTIRGVRHFSGVALRADTAPATNGRPSAAEEFGAVPISAADVSGLVN